MNMKLTTKTFLAALGISALPLATVNAHEGHDHAASPAPQSASATEAWAHARASVKAMQAAALAKQHEPIHNEQEKLVSALKQVQEKATATDEARLHGAIKNAIAASEKVHAAADAKDFAKVESSLKALEATMSLVEKQLGSPAK